MTIHIAQPGGAQEIDVGVQLPPGLPVLPLKETVTFPGMLTPLAIGQERSVKLINDVLGGERMLAMVASRNPELDLTGPEEEAPAVQEPVKKKRRAAGRPAGAPTV